MGSAIEKFTISSKNGILKFHNPTFGGDPEGFLTTQNGEVIAPLPSLIEGWGKILSCDGAQLELHPEPNCCRGYFVDTMRSAVKAAVEVAAKNNLIFTIAAAIPTLASTRRTFPPRANLFGCDADWCAYKLVKIYKPRDARNHRWRYGGGHIHLGINDQQNFIPHLPGIIRITDVLAGIVSVALDIDTLAARKRRKLFGRAGSFRIQPHGYEYRVLDNTILRHPKLVYMFTGLVRDAYTIYCLNKLPNCRDHLLNISPIAQDIINECDVEAARRFWIENVAGCVESVANSEISLCWSDLRWATKMINKVLKYLAPLCTGANIHDVWKLDTKFDFFKHGTFCGGGIENLLNRE